MSEKTLPSRDEVERFKPYIEIAKYAISISLALAAVCGFLIRLRLTSSTSHNFSSYFFIFGIFFNIFFFFICHKLVSESAQAITHKMSAKKREEKLEFINATAYSRFVIFFVLNLVFWSFAILFAAL